MLPEATAAHGWRVDTLAGNHPLSIVRWIEGSKQMDVLSLESGAWRGVGAFGVSFPHPATLACGPAGLILVGRLNPPENGRGEDQFRIVDTQLAEFDIIREHQLDWRYGISIPSKRQGATTSRP